MITFWWKIREEPHSLALITVVYSHSIDTLIIIIVKLYHTEVKMDHFKLKLNSLRS